MFRLRPMNSSGFALYCDNFEVAKATSGLVYCERYINDPISFLYSIFTISSFPSLIVEQFVLFTFIPGSNGVDAGLHSCMLYLAIIELMYVFYDNCIVSDCFRSIFTPMAWCISLRSFILYFLAILLIASEIKLGSFENIKMSFTYTIAVRYFFFQ